MLRRRTIHLEPAVNDWLEHRAAKAGKSVNQEINDLLALLKGKHDQHQRQQAHNQKRAEMEAMQAKIAAIRNQKAALEGAAH